jgi:hypothetical protein
MCESISFRDGCLGPERSGSGAGGGVSEDSRGRRELLVERQARMTSVLIVVCRKMYKWMLDSADGLAVNYG